MRTQMSSMCVRHLSTRFSKQRRENIKPMLAVVQVDLSVTEFRVACVHPERGYDIIRIDTAGQSKLLAKATVLR